MINKSKIAMLSTVINFDLYSKSSKLFPKGISKLVIDGRNGMHGIESLCYMMNRFWNNDIDWLVMADEDVLFTKSDAIFDLIEKMSKENYMVCGVRDGGVIDHRNFNPFVINTFFSVINFKELKKIWNPKEMLSHQHIKENEFRDDLSGLPFSYDIESLYEPYYCFYLWLRRNGKKILFLDAIQPFKQDLVSNAVYFDDEVILYHTWYARSYQKNERQTERINTIFNLIDKKGENDIRPIIVKDFTYAFRKSMRKILKKINRE